MTAPTPTSRRAAPPPTIEPPRPVPVGTAVRDTLVAALVAGASLGVGWGALAWLFVEHLRLIGAVVPLLGAI